jgi:hypothetical protein
LAVINSFILAIRSAVCAKLLFYTGTNPIPEVDGQKYLAEIVPGPLVAFTEAPFIAIAANSSSLIELGSTLAKVCEIG